MNQKTKEDVRLKKIEKAIERYRFAAFTFIILGFLSVGIVWYQNNYVHPMQWNEVGDYLGGTMAGLWSLAGLFFIYVAFLGQRLDIQLTKNELQETRKVHDRQTTLLNRQQFDNLFFNLIQTHNQIVNDLDVSIKYPIFLEDEQKEGIVEAQGRDVFKEVYDKKIRWRFDDKVEAYGEIYDEFNSEFGHYYRFLYRIIDTIDNQNFVQSVSGLDDISKGEKEKIITKMNYKIQYEYVSFVRALLSDAELELLFLNMLYWEDLKFKPLIEKYCLLKNISNPHRKIKNYQNKFNPGAILKEDNSNF